MTISCLEKKELRDLSKNEAEKSSSTIHIEDPSGYQVSIFKLEIILFL